MPIPSAPTVAAAASATSFLPSVRDILPVVVFTYLDIGSYQGILSLLVIKSLRCLWSLTFYRHQS